MDNPRKLTGVAEVTMSGSVIPFSLSIILGWMSSTMGLDICVLSLAFSLVTVWMLVAVLISWINSEDTSCFSTFKTNHLILLNPILLQDKKIDNYKKIKVIIIILTY